MEGLEWHGACWVMRTRKFIGKRDGVPHRGTGIPVLTQGWESPSMTAMGWQEVVERVRRLSGAPSRCVFKHNLRAKTSDVCEIGGTAGLETGCKRDVCLQWRKEREFVRYGRAYCVQKVEFYWARRATFDPVASVLGGPTLSTRHRETWQFCRAKSFSGTLAL
jgi:hypothetical protein